MPRHASSALRQALPNRRITLALLGLELLELHQCHMFLGDRFDAGKIALRSCAFLPTLKPGVPDLTIRVCTPVCGNTGRSPRETLDAVDGASWRLGHEGGNGENKPIRSDQLVECPSNKWASDVFPGPMRAASHNTKERRSTRLRSSTWSDASRGSAKWLPLG
jgi:hypothetical protein